MSMVTIPDHARAEIIIQNTRIILYLATLRRAPNRPPMRWGRHVTPPERSHEPPTAPLGRIPSPPAGVTAPAPAGLHNSWTRPRRSPAQPGRFGQCSSRFTASYKGDGSRGCQGPTRPGAVPLPSPPEPLNGRAAQPRASPATSTARAQRASPSRCIAAVAKALGDCIGERRGRAARLRTPARRPRPPGRIAAPANRRAGP